MVDRSVMAPLIPVIADDMDASLTAVGDSLAVYAISYAAMQLVWSALSTRWGRIRVLTISTAVAALANFATMLSPDPLTFLIARGASGAAFAATFTAVLIYFGDTLTMRQRAVATANLAAAVALGMAGGILGAGVIAQWWSWRLVFVVIALACLVLAVLMLRLPNPIPAERERILSSLIRLCRNRWAIAVLLLMVLEGALLMGVFNFVPVSLQARGESVVVASLVTAAFGVAIIVFSQLMKLVIHYWPSWLLLLLGGSAMVGAYAVIGWRITPLTALIAATAMGLGWALAHTTMQTWMTDAVADGRAMGMSFFSIAMFGGASIGAAIGNVAAAESHFDYLFVGARIDSVVFALAAGRARRSYRVKEE
jgi:DHA1 family inner membrane transport protein